MKYLKSDNDNPIHNWDRNFRVRNFGIETSWFEISASLTIPRLTIIHSFQGSSKIHTCQRFLQRSVEVNAILQRTLLLNAFLRRSLKYKTFLRKSLKIKTYLQRFFEGSSKESIISKDLARNVLFVRTLEGIERFLQG